MTAIVYVLALAPWATWQEIGMILVVACIGQETKSLCVHCHKNASDSSSGCIYLGILGNAAIYRNEPICCLLCPRSQGKYI